MEENDETPGTPESVPPPVKPATTQMPNGGGAFFVSLGIFASRVFGLLRQLLQAKYLGAGAAADAFTAAFKIQISCKTCSAKACFRRRSSKYAHCSPTATGRAGRLAGAVRATLADGRDHVLVGVVATPVIIPLIAAGSKPYQGLMIRYTRILFRARDSSSSRPGASAF